MSHLPYKMEKQPSEQWEEQEGAMQREQSPGKWQGHTSHRVKKIFKS